MISWINASLISEKKHRQNRKPYSQGPTLKITSQDRNLDLASLGLLYDLDMITSQGEYWLSQIPRESRRRFEVYG